ncbi:hypothetical protein V501_01221 [Pseudogymnoascus sp. VKM F-4519 (FW-2642)]|nr:hypothetical protein V501_01221 [Pseudogymnoascus sp. VKM F-4519 (FW-2642)]
MRFTTVFFAGAFTALAAAQSSAANPFTNTDYTSISAGKAFTITWSPTTTGAVSLVLVKGNPAALTTVSTIASSLDNSGSFNWTPDSSIAKGSDYALKIVDDTDATIVNYTLQFPIDSAGAADSVVSSVVATTTANDASKETTALDIKTSIEITESAAPDITTSTADANPTDTSTADDSTTLATVTTPNESSSAFSAPDNGATTKPSASTTRASESSTVSESSSTGVAAATGAANVCGGLMGFVGAAMLLL